MTSKLFFEVFQTLEVDKGLSDLFSDSRITRIITSNTMDNFRIYVESNHIIAKKKIWEMEKAIKETVFGYRKVKVIICESFQLSSQYKPEHIWREYRESVIAEIDTKGVILRQMLGRADAKFEQKNILCLKLSNTIIAQHKQVEIVHFIEEIYEHRFNMPIEVRVIFAQERDERLEMRTQQMMQEVDVARKAILDANEKREEALLNGNAELAKTKSETAKRQKNWVNNKSKGRNKQAAKSNDPDMIIGKFQEEKEAVKLKEIIGDMGMVTVRGEILEVNSRELKNGEKSIVTLLISDYTDSINVKLFVKNSELEDLLEKLKKGTFVKVEGVSKFDAFDKEVQIASPQIKKISDFREKRTDTAPVKRVELHCHTKMSDMDGVSDVSDIVKRAHEYGHPAIAITDHGVVQAFPDANHVIEKLDKDDPFKVIYGVEGYVVDDLEDLAKNEKGQTLEETFVVFDLETT
jgi:DNA polymerase-3 subunit alpha (Gram-positive type)